MAFHLHKRLLSAAIVATFSCVVLAAPAIAAEAPRFNISSLKENQKYDRFIIRYRTQATDAKANVSAALVQSVSAAFNRAGLKRPASTDATLGASGVVYIRKLATGAHVVRTNKLSKTEATALIQQIAADPAVAHVEPDVKMQAISDSRAGATVKMADFLPNDPGFGTNQWDLRAGDGTMETVDADPTAYANRGGADVAKAWDLADGHGVTVAVLDTGITHHPDLDTSLGDAGYDFISDAATSGRDTDDRVPGGWDLGDWTDEAPWNQECMPRPSNWHGTHVAGTIAELTNNNVGLAGVAFGAKLLPVRVLGHCGGYTSDIADAIVWASGGHVDGVPDNTHPAQVINMSLGGSGSCLSDDETGMAISDAISRGTTVVVAAGNEEDDTVNYSPSSCPGVVNVASIGITGKRAFYSNFGNLVTLAAPGGGVYPDDAAYGDQVPAGFVWSTVNGSLTSPDENDYTYAGIAGTSQATPHVAGTVALVISALNSAGLPAMSPSEIKSLLTSTARAFPTKPDARIGAGIVDAYAAVQKAVSGTPGGGDPDDGILLDNGGVLNGIYGASGDTVLYKVTVNPNTSALVLRTFGGSGDVSLYVKRDAAPTASEYDRASVHAGNNESITITRPAAGTYYLLVSGVTSFENLSVQASYR